MGSKKCKKVKKCDKGVEMDSDDKFQCKKCKLTSNKEKKLCKPEKQ